MPTGIIPVNADRPRPCPGFGHVELSVQHPVGLSEAENAALLLGYEQQHDATDRTGDPPKESSLLGLRSGDRPKSILTWF